MCALWCACDIHFFFIYYFAFNSLKPRLKVGPFHCIAIATSLSWFIACLILLSLLLTCSSVFIYSSKRNICVVTRDFQSIVYLVSLIRHLIYLTRIIRVCGLFKIIRTDWSLCGIQHEFLYPGTVFIGVEEIPMV